MRCFLFPKNRSWFSVRFSHKFVYNLTHQLRHLRKYLQNLSMNFILTNTNTCIHLDTHTYIHSNTYINSKCEKKKQKQKKTHGTKRKQRKKRTRQRIKSQDTGLAHKFYPHSNPSIHQNPKAYIIKSIILTLAQPIEPSCKPQALNLSQPKTFFKVCRSPICWKPERTS